MNKYFSKHTLTLFLSILFTSSALAQIAEDALLISRTMPVGTARFQGLGGAGVALGGDVSSAFVNPAGLGFFNRSQAVLTPSFSNINANTRFLGTTADNFNNDFNIANFGVVINNTDNDLIPSDYRGGSFAITFNRTNSYNYGYSFGPAENPFSIMDDFALQSDGIPDSELAQNSANRNIVGYPDAAFGNFLINPLSTGPNPDDVEYVPSIPLGTLVSQEGFFEEQGRQSQWNFSYGGNYKDKVYFGAGVGFRSFSYVRGTVFQETPIYSTQYEQDVQEGRPFFPVDDQLSINFVDFVELDETLNIEGNGINASLGVIYRPIDELTLGVSYVTPTFYGITERYQFTLQSEVSGIQETDDSEPFNITASDRVRGNENVSEYTLSIPSRLSGGFAYFFDKYGFITADVEYVNYEANRYNSDNFNTGDLNQEVDDILEPVINYKVGGEFRYKVFRLRGGYAMQTDPTQYQNDNLDRDRVVISGGVGISTPKFFADLGIINTRFETDFFPYQGAAFFPVEDIPQSNNNITNVVLSVGFNF